MNEIQTQGQARSDSPRDGRRRTFLAAALCTPAIAAVAILTRRNTVEASLPAIVDDAEAGTGYHETEHIRRYYRSAAYY